jgi:hypothetical protein
MDNEHAEVTVEMWISPTEESDSWLYVASHKVPHFVNIDNNHLGGTTSIFKTFFAPFRTTGVIRLLVETKLNNVHLLTQN